MAGSKAAIKSTPCASLWNGRFERQESGCMCVCVLKSMWRNSLFLLAEKNRVCMCVFGKESEEGDVSRIKIIGNVRVCYLHVHSSVNYTVECKCIEIVKPGVSQCLWLSVCVCVQVYISCFKDKMKWCLKPISVMWCISGCEEVQYILNAEGQNK